MALDPFPGIQRPEQLRIASVLGPMRSRIFKTKSPKLMQRAIAYQRAPGVTSHGRFLDARQFAQMIAMTAAALRQRHRPAEVTVFNGMARGSQMTMSFQEQFELFSSAFLAFGPHGTGLSNIVWMQSGADCDRGPAVIEFMCSPDTVGVRGCFVWSGKRKQLRMQSYWRLYGGAYWIRYFLVWLLKRDDHPSDTAKVDLEGFNMSLAAALDEGGAGPGMRRLRAAPILL